MPIFKKKKTGFTDLRPIRHEQNKAEILLNNFNPNLPLKK